MFKILKNLNLLKGRKPEPKKKSRQVPLQAKLKPAAKMREKGK